MDGAQGQRQSEGKKPGGGHEHGGHGRGGGHGRKGKREEKGGGKPPPPPPPATRHSFLDGCMDGKPDDCKEKATGKFCLTHAAEMAAKCRESCGLCRRTRVPHPPRDRDLLPDSQGRPYPSVGLSVNVSPEPHALSPVATLHFLWFCFILLLPSQLALLVPPPSLCNPDAACSPRLAPPNRSVSPLPPLTNLRSQHPQSLTLCLAHASPSLPRRC